MKQLNYKIAFGIAMALGSLNAFAAGPDFTTVISVTANQPKLTFNDNSTIAGNENTDWEICVDDDCTFSADEPEGGFSVTMRDNNVASTDRRPLTIQNNVRTDALRLNGNNVGMGTATPAEELHIFSPGFAFGTPPFQIYSAGQPSIRLESQTSAAGASQRWDINGTAGVFSVEDVTDGTISI